MGLNLNVADIELSEGYDNKLLPPGDYLCQLERATDEADLISRAGDKYSRINLMFRILEGDYANKVIFHTPIYDHSLAEVDEKKALAVQIGCEFLKRYHIAANCEGEIDVPSLLTGGACNIKLKVRKGGIKDASTGEKYEDTNNVVGVAAAEGSSAQLRVSNRNIGGQLAENMKTVSGQLARSNPF